MEGTEGSTPRVLERYAPVTAAIGAGSAAVVNVFILFQGLSVYGGLVTRFLYSNLEYLTATILYLLFLPLFPAFAALVACTCFHPRQLPFGGRMRAFVGAFTGGYLIFGLPLIGGLIFPPLLAALSVQYYHRKIGPLEKPEPLPAAASERGVMYLLGYLLAFAVLSILVFLQSLAVSGRGGLFLILLLPLFGTLYVAGGVLLYQVLLRRRHGMRRAGLWAGLTLHAVPLFAILVFAFVFALPRVLLGDFTLQDPYTQRVVTDYSLIADPILGGFTILALVEYLRALRVDGSRFTGVTEF
ncbi:MAG: hypothetical protein ACE5LS_06785 [Thermoplasmata archaeon]